VYDPPMTFTILSGRWVGNTGCPAKSSTKGGHPRCPCDLEGCHVLFGFRIPLACFCSAKREALRWTGCVSKKLSDFYKTFMISRGKSWNWTVAPVKKMLFK
jgi:hypothetical protein